MSDMEEVPVYKKDLQGYAFDKPNQPPPSLHAAEPGMYDAVVYDHVLLHWDTL